MLSEEIGLNSFLESCGVEVFETDLGEYIIQLLGEPPSHIVGPSIHKSLDDTRVIFHERLGTPRDASPERLAEAARDLLREAFLTADLGISGGNFLVRRDRFDRSDRERGQHQAVDLGSADPHRAGRDREGAAQMGRPSDLPPGHRPSRRPASRWGASFR